MRRFCKGLVHRGGVAGMEVEGDVVRDIVVKLRRARSRCLFSACHGGKRLDIEDDCLRRIAGLGERRRNHESDRIANETHLYR